ncbi:hypothetical protein [Elizabethkingia meningoseptica]|uniref:hypothetical protein n=1 Tax=Elizabethkingia meningoseptica TaxID=238 RepID=UPI0009362743|nr:hypothetical protein [Elizabethkingia meningoseptica]
MKKNGKTKGRKEKKSCKENMILRKEYVCPTIEVTFVEMECGLAINSAPVSPVRINGNVAQVPTEWAGNDGDEIHTPF